MSNSIAIVGVACVYPDARSAIELWQNALAGRRAFRRIPPERLRLEDYFSANRDLADHTYSSEAAVIEGYEFDRVRFRVSGDSFRSADPAHWLTLDVAARALNDAGFHDGESIPRDTTGVFLGNTLTGDVSRAGVLRLRWPYVRRVVQAALVNEGWSVEQRRPFLNKLEEVFKQPFPAVSEESLAGGLSNTIAGRICNHFDLKGGGFTVDGACASSLLAVTTACSSLVDGDLDVAIAGGVDLSIDPFELVGFAKAGALAAEKMRVFDARSEGFWPGEGCGFVVLMRYEDALAQRRRIYAVIRGWGVSSDGSGGITRPEVKGQLLALRRAYRRAGYGIDTVVYFEGHGTGTSVGDATELKALTLARREAAIDSAPAVIGSIKANIGHTKAAAGVAGLIKATMAINAQILPPTTGCEEPHPELRGEKPALRVLSEGEIWPANRPLRAGVSAMGFGGINTHVTLEAVAAERRNAITISEKAILSSAQDCELFLIAAQETGELRQQVEHLLTFAATLSQAELTDLAAEMERKISNHRDTMAAPVRAAIVASTAAEMSARLEALKLWLTSGVTEKIDARAGIFLGKRRDVPHIGFLFPGQGSPSHTSGGALRRRFDFVGELYEELDLPTSDDDSTTAVAQPAIVTASMAGLRALDRLGVTACVAVGHSLGEITALHWAGAMDEKALVRIARIRGAIMASLNGVAGAMASIKAGQREVEALLNGYSIVIAGLNSPSQTVVSGEATAVAGLAARARSMGFGVTNLSVSHAFHSPLVAAAAPLLAEHLAHEQFGPMQRRVVSTVTEAPISADEDLRQLLCRQVTSPVRFFEAVSKSVEGLDFLIEVGPGEVLSGIANEFIDIPVVALDAGGSSLKGLLQATGAAFALGAPIDHEALFAGRFARPFSLDWRPRFIVNPCELAPLPYEETRQGEAETRQREGKREGKIQSTEIVESSVLEPPSAPANTSPLELLRDLVARRAELPLSAVKDDSRLLGDLHFNSITVSQILAEAARHLGMPPLTAPTDFSNVTISEAADALEELARAGASLSHAEHQPQGVDSWIRSFGVEMVERALPRRQVPTRPGVWKIVAPANYPLTEALKEAFASWGRDGGIVLCLPPEPDERHVSLLLESARAVLSEKTISRFVLVQDGCGAASFARTLHLEAPELTTSVVDVPIDHPEAVTWVLAEAKAAAGYSEAHYDSKGLRREPVLRLLPISEESNRLPLEPDDVLLITGGGKGIAAECALSLARETGASLVLLGRSHPDEDGELAANLDRLKDVGIHFRYYSADVTDAEAVRAAIGEAQAELGIITGFLHGAGTNVPQLLGSLDETEFLNTLAPKLQGARNVLAAINPNRLRLLITFGSLIARTGMRGEAHYAVANEWLARVVEQWQAQHPHCRCLNVEWSVWAGVGMGERLGTVDALMQQGITPIPIDEGIRILSHLLRSPGVSNSVVVTGRFGQPPTLTLETSELPFLRFLEQPRVFYPGVELIVDAELSTETDPYLDEHIFRGERLFPAVIGLEAMAQVAMAVSGSSLPPIFEQVQFSRPIVVPKDRIVTVRLASLVRAPNEVEVVLRTSETAFAVDHFKAVCRFASEASVVGRQSALDSNLHGDASSLPIDPQRDLYGGILFHEGRFRRLKAYRHLRATECIAEISSSEAKDWFGPYLPSDMILGDAAARDAAIHAIQACIPHSTLLPVGVDRLVPDLGPTTTVRFVHAQERMRDDDTLTYDLEVLGSDGCVRERWEGLRLKVVDSVPLGTSWAEPLLGPYIERRISELVQHTAIGVSLERDASIGHRHRSDRAIGRALGKEVQVRRRPDGKPDVTIDGSVEASTSHAGELIMAVAGPSPLSCDIEQVITRPSHLWKELLGAERFALAQLIAGEASEELEAAATRIWAASECLKKGGAMVNAPLILSSLSESGWVLLLSGPLIIATLVTQVRNEENKLAVAVLVRGKQREKRHGANVSQ
ncbi:MAG: SDR family NAD(P)-dependent oxidoreductase [Acidobacteriota bacterium]